MPLFFSVFLDLPFSSSFCHSSLSSSFASPFPSFLQPFLILPFFVLACPLTSFPRTSLCSFFCYSPPFPHSSSATCHPSSRSFQLPPITGPLPGPVTHPTFHCPFRNLSPQGLLQRPALATASHDLPIEPSRCSREPLRPPVTSVSAPLQTLA